MKRKLLSLALALLMAQPGLAIGLLKQSTATEITLKFVDKTDGVTAETALTVTNFDCNLVKHADANLTATPITVTASLGVNDSSHLADGIYRIELTATDTNTAGRLLVHCQEPTNAAPYEKEYMVIPAATWDFLVGGQVSSIDDYWEYLLTNIGTAGGIGKLIKDFLDVAISSRLGAPRSALAQAGGANTITLDTGALANNNAYRGNLIVITGGTGIGQTALIRSYDGTTKVATVSCYGTTTGNWHTNPDATSVFQIIPAR